MEELNLIKEKAKRELKERIFDNKEKILSLKEDLRRKAVKEISDNILRKIVNKSKLVLSEQELDNFSLEIVSEVIGYGGLEDLMKDPLITDILVNSPFQVFIEKGGELKRVELNFKSAEEIKTIIERMLTGSSRRIDQFSPFVDFRLDDGSRVTAVIPPVSISPSICIRKFTAEAFQPQDLINLGTLTPEVLDFLELSVKSRLNILITGSTGAGKTTLLNTLLRFVPNNERMIIIEDTEELSLSEDFHFLKLLTRSPNIEGKGEITLYDLVRLSLHLRPDRIIIGEVRGEEVFYFLQAINTGHEGSMCTLHANDTFDALIRLETLGLMAKPNIQAEVIKRFLSRGVDLVIHLKRTLQGRRVISQISEVVYEQGDYKVKDIFSLKTEFKEDKETLKGEFTGYIPSFRNKIKVRTGKDFFG
ncbi:MAG TPA: CpaF family protein [Candidatus Omnitrophica bacterium]|nr:MAG: CpaF family protein [Candidatus Omnitrophota bacterium]RKY35663.1 MAG: CpaF family protein [Candidatus Omnitrophota bacterium]RKY43717.1 MAG: CpaF family protein [Candidatus Omnitrophota bacterium]HEC69020.1 CpaF family protein [Candidatus Omnitrophota bacterium]